MKSSEKLYLLDGSNYLYRAYYGIREPAGSEGMPTNAVFGFTRMLLSLLRENRPDYLAVVFDPPREESFRRRIYPAYKAHREAVPEDLAIQLPYIRKIVQALNVAALEVPGFEADDVLATLARSCAGHGVEVTVVTGDKDLLQIVGDGIRLLDTMKGKLSGPQEVLDRFGVTAELVPDVLGLAGDASDNIPGVPGIGEKTAAKLVQQFGSLEGVLEWKSLVNGRSRLETPDALKNQDLWRQLSALSGLHQVVWEWLPGHAGHHFNERCDRLAKRAAQEGGGGATTPPSPVDMRTQGESVSPSPLPALALDPRPCRDAVEFDTDDDGQLLLC